MTTIQATAVKSLDEPDDVVDLGKGTAHLVTLGGVTFDRTVFEPGWKWSEHVKPAAGTNTCQFPHRLIVTEGTIHVLMDDGTELDLGPGDAAVIAPGHDAWVTGDVPCVVYGIDSPDQDYGKPAN